jgi:hypothetical protein
LEGCLVHRWCWYGGGRGLLGGAAFPVIFSISYSVWAVGRSSQILVSFTNPVPRGLVSIIISPLSTTYKRRWAAYLYTICLFWYSIFVSDMLQRISPLLLLIPAYSYLLLDFVGQSSTNRCSPGGAATLTQPVSRANSFPNYLEISAFQSSFSPLYLRVCLSRDT